MAKGFEKALVAAIRNVRANYKRRASITFDEPSRIGLNMQAARLGDANTHVANITVRDREINATETTSAWRVHTGFWQTNAGSSAVGDIRIVGNSCDANSRYAAIRVDPLKPKRYEPEPGDEYWYVYDEPYLIGSRLGLRHDKWRDAGSDFDLLRLNTLYRTRDEAKAELFKRQGEK